jgi:hypothetical protein
VKKNSLRASSSIALATVSLGLICSGSGLIGAALVTKAKTPGTQVVVASIPAVPLIVDRVQKVAPLTESPPNLVKPTLDLLPVLPSPLAALTPGRAQGYLSPPILGRVVTAPNRVSPKRKPIEEPHKCGSECFASPLKTQDSQPDQWFFNASGSKKFKPALVSVSEGANRD